MSRAGFTLLEVTIALVLLAFGVLGLTVTTGSIGRSAATAEIEARALEVVHERLNEVLIHPGYASLDSIFDGTSSIPELPGHTLVTSVDRVVTAGSTGLQIDFVRIVVSVTGPRLDRVVRRTTVVGAP